MSHAENIKNNLDNKLLKVPTVPGVYIFFGQDKKCLYIGKAINLKNRVKSYFNKKLSPRLTIMINEVVDFEITQTSSSHAALLLENNFIKEYKPKYNILFRDDKTYPYLRITPHDYPRIMFYRGVRKEGRDYFGPFPDSAAVRRSIDLLQKIFKIRSCTDSIFKNRTKPCLLYSIKRCSAPCVNYISQEEYNENITSIKKMLAGKKQDMEIDLRKKMEAAAANLDFELAAKYRDHIKYLAVLKNQHYVDEKNIINLDYIGIHQGENDSCINLVSIRNGVRIGENRFFSKSKNASATEILSAFIDYYYKDDSKINIITEHDVSNDFINRKISRPVTKEQKFRIAEANQNAKLAIELKMTNFKKLIQLGEALGIENLSRLECFDISHHSGDEPVASRVVFINGEKCTQQYRRYSIDKAIGGDDVKSIGEAVSRCYTRTVKESLARPDLIIIDGGKTQLSSAIKSLPKEMKNSKIIGFSKGRGRKSGDEKIILPDGSEFEMSSFSGGFHLLQEIRDEAHRFALFGHRIKKNKKTIKSVLDDIEGIGPKKKKELIMSMGGIDRVKQASVTQLSKIKGISAELAEKIYNHIH